MALRALAPNSVRTYERYARQFLAHVDRPLATVTRQDIEGYVHTLIAKARSPRTRNVQLGAIRCLLLATGHRDRTAEDRRSMRVSVFAPTSHLPGASTSPPPFRDGHPLG